MDRRTPTPPHVVKAQPVTPRRVLDVATVKTPVDAIESWFGNRLRTSEQRSVPVIFLRQFYLLNLNIIRSVEDVSPSILADIQDHATCTVEELLNGLLSRCLPEEHKSSPPSDLLNQCISAVLPICNTQDHPITTKGKQKLTRKHWQTAWDYGHI